MESNGENPFDGVVKLITEAEDSLGEDKLKGLTSTAIMDAVKQQIAVLDSSGIYWDSYTARISVTFYIEREQFAETLERALNESLKTTEKEHN